MRTACDRRIRTAGDNPETRMHPKRLPDVVDVNDTPGALKTYDTPGVSQTFAPKETMFFGWTLRGHAAPDRYDPNDPHDNRIECNIRREDRGGPSSRKGRHGAPIGRGLAALLKSRRFKAPHCADVDGSTSVR